MNHSRVLEKKAWKETAKDWLRATDIMQQIRKKYIGRLSMLDDGLKAETISKNLFVEGSPLKFTL